MEDHNRLSRLFSGNLPAMFMFTLIAYKFTQKRTLKNKEEDKALKHIVSLSLFLEAVPGSFRLIGRFIVIK